MVEKIENIKGKILIGWKEWCSLPLLKIPAIKAKIDTGAKTSALHAFDIKPVEKHGEEFVSFSIYPLQSNRTVVTKCIAPILDIRTVMSSNGLKEVRYVILTDIQLADSLWPIEITLSNRDPLKFRMLLGREALNGRVLIDPKHALCLGKKLRKDLKKLYHSL